MEAKLYPELLDLYDNHGEIYETTVQTDLTRDNFEPAPGIYELGKG